MDLPTEETKISVSTLLGVGIPFPVAYVKFPFDRFRLFTDFYMCIVYVSCVCVQLLDYFRE